MEPRNLKRALLWALIACFPAFACRPGCEGPGCEDDFNAALIGLHRGADLPLSGLRSPRADAWVNLRGTPDLGPELTAAAIPGLLILGSPEEELLFTVPLRSDSDGRYLALPRFAVRTTQPGDLFGAALTRGPDLDGDGAADLLVGSPNWNQDGISRHTGAVHLISGLETDLDEDAYINEAARYRLEGVENGAELGRTLQLCPDMDGDGLAEALVGAPWANGEEGLEGEVFLATSTDFARTDGLLRTTALNTRWTGGALGARAGTAIHCGHDLFGDPTPDILIGAPFFDGEHEAEGAVFLVDGAARGSAARLPAATHRVFRGETTDAWAGWSLTAGDLDGDGSPEVIVGAPGTLPARQDSQLATGMVLIYDGAALRSRGTLQPRFRIRASETGGGFGRTVRAGDVDGDGIDDLLVGAPRLNPNPANNVAYDAGALYLFRGAADFAGWRPAMEAESDADLIWEEARAYLRTGRLLELTNLDGDTATDLIMIHPYDPA